MLNFFRYERKDFTVVIQPAFTDVRLKLTTIKTEMEKRADSADISVLFFSGCANFLAVCVQTS